MVRGQVSNREQRLRIDAGPETLHNAIDGYLRGYQATAPFQAAWDEGGRLVGSAFGYVEFLVPPTEGWSRCLADAVGAGRYAEGSIVRSGSPGSPYCHRCRGMVLAPRCTIASWQASLASAPGSCVRLRKGSSGLSTGDAGGSIWP